MIILTFAFDLYSILLFIIIFLRTFGAYSAESQQTKTQGT